MDPEPVKKLTKTQKQRAKKAEWVRKQEAAVKADEENSKSGRGTNERSRIEELLTKRGLAPFTIPADGDCLYNSLAHQLNSQSQQQTSTGDTIREKVADHMLANPDDFKPFVENGDLDETRYANYCNQKVRRSCRAGGDWGGACELQAASGALQRRIEILNTDGAAHQFGEHYTSTSPLVITFHKHAFTLGEHYNSTQPKS